MNNEILNIFKKIPDFDLYFHLKSNIKGQALLCEIHESSLVTYCLTCRKSICEICRETFHGSHVFIEKNEFLGNRKNLINIKFSNLEKKIKESEIFELPKKVLEEEEQ